MKVKIKNENKSTEIKYPCLMVSARGTIVLFCKSGVGTVIRSDTSPVGSYENGWCMDLFTPFTGTIELSND